MTSPMHLWLSQIVYKPGSTLELVPDPEHTPAGWLLVVTLRQADLTGCVEYRYPMPLWVQLPAATDQAVFHQFVRSALNRAELSETRRWFRHRDTGQPVFNPHQEDR